MKGNLVNSKKEAKTGSFHENKFTEKQKKEFFTLSWIVLLWWAKFLLGILCEVKKDPPIVLVGLFLSDGVLVLSLIVFDDGNCLNLVTFQEAFSITNAGKSENRSRTHQTDEVNSQKDLSCGLQRSAASFLSVNLSCSAGQNQETSDDGQRPGVHPDLQENANQGKHQQSHVCHRFAINISTSKQDKIF